MAGVSLIVSSPPNMFFNFKKYGKSTRVSNHENCDVAEEIEKILLGGLLTIRDTPAMCENACIYIYNKKEMQ